MRAAGTRMVFEVCYSQESIYNVFLFETMRTNIIADNVGYGRISFIIIMLHTVKTLNCLKSKSFQLYY